MTEATATPADRLEAGVEDLRVPEPSGDAEGLLVKVGVILPVIGIVMVVLAYWGASGTAYVTDQIPMLISGGLLGLGLAMVGIGLYLRFALARVLRFWLARMVAEQQAQTDRVVAALERVEAALGDR